MKSMMKGTAWFIILLLMMVCCSTKTEVDLLVYNGVVYTADDAFSVANAFAVKDGNIMDIGDQGDIIKKYRSRNSLDLKGLPVFPGFIDAHCHFYGYGLMEETKVDLSGSLSPEEMVQRLKVFHDLHPGPYLEGRGWDQNLWKDKQFPDKALIDSVFPDIPVLLTRVDGHAMLLNSKAITLAGITPNMEVEGGQILLQNGQMTGILVDKAMQLAVNIIPPPDHDLMIRALLKAQDDCFSLGLTMVADAGLKYHIIDLIDSLQQSKLLRMRVYAMVEPDETSLARFLQSGIVDKEKLIVRSIKLYADGALGSRGALLLQPYHDDPGSYGLSMMPWEKIKSYCQIAYDNGFQVNIHAIGDSAVRQILSIYAGFLHAGNDLRWRIEHAQVVHPDDLPLFGKYSIVPSIQATHATSDMYWAGERLGDRLPTAYAYRELLLQNSWLPNGTDFPIEQINPILTFYASVFRKDQQGYPQEGFQPANALSRTEALLSMTKWAAKSCFAENRTGSLEMGKKADFVILNNDIMLSGPEEVLQTEVIATYLDGIAVYQR